MANVGQTVEREQLAMIECSICMSSITDPRMLPCNHTFCFKCLKSTGEATQKNPGDKIPCPLCRKDFIIPPDGIKGLQKNYFMENLLQYKIKLQMESVAIICDICNASNDNNAGQIPTATMRCLECQDNYCDSCFKVYQFQTLSRNHQVEQIGGETNAGMTPPSTVKYCTRHTKEQLKYYCADCKNIVCVSCFVESHKLHDCKDVNTLDKQFRHNIERKVSQITALKDEMLSIRYDREKVKEDFLKKLDAKEKEIHNRSRVLKDTIDRHTQSLVYELSVIKSAHLKKMENQVEEIERCCTILRSFEAYCTELVKKGSAGDICSSFDQLIVRSDELEREHKVFIGRPYQSVEVTFQATDLLEDHQNVNFNLVGKVEESIEKSESFAFVMGFYNRQTKEVIKINLHRPNEISTKEHIPARMRNEAFAAVYCNTMYVSGIGVNLDEIWKYDITSGWTKCTFLVQGRQRHSAAFINEVLYICGGIHDSDGTVLDSVEAYNAITDKCTIVGKLVYCVQSAGNCVPFMSSLYIFGGREKDRKR